MNKLKSGLYVVNMKWGVGSETRVVKGGAENGEIWIQAEDEQDLVAEYWMGGDDVPGAGPGCWEGAEEAVDMEGMSTCFVLSTLWLAAPGIRQVPVYLFPELSSREV